MNWNRIPVFLLFFSACLPVILHADTRVSGDVSGIWRVDGSHYTVVDDILLRSDRNLSIEPGVEVVFVDDFTFNIRELNSLRERALDEVEALYVDMDILIAEDMRDGHELDAAVNRFQRLADIRQRIDEIEAGKINPYESAAEVSEFKLISAYPNPFNSSVRFSFAMPEAAMVDATVFDLNGRKVDSFTRWFASGVHHVTWSAEGYAAGTYLLRINACDKSLTQKLLLVK